MKSKTGRNLNSATRVGGTSWFMSCLLAIVLVFSMSPFTSAPAYAEDTQGTDQTIIAENVALEAIDDVSDIDENYGVVAPEAPISLFGDGGEPSQVSEPFTTDWSRLVYYQGYQSATTYVPDNSSRAPYETYGIWLNQPSADGASVDTQNHIDDVILTDPTKYDPGVINGDPAYYYNVITRPYNAASVINFMWERQGPGGNHGSYAAMGQYVKIYSKLGSDGRGDPNSLVYACADDGSFTSNTGYRQHYTNWCSGFNWSIPAGTLQDNFTYYLIFEKGHDMGNGGTNGRVVNADVVFEFTTDQSVVPISYSAGTDIITAYNAHQGRSAVVDLTEPVATSVSTNVTQSRANSAYLNEISESIDPSNAKFTFILSGSNSQSFSESVAKQYSYPNIHIYSVDGVDITGSGIILDPSKIVADWTDDPSTTDMDFVFTAKVEPTYLTIHDDVLEEAKDYYLVFESTCGVGVNSRTVEPVIFKFSTGASTTTSWDVSATQSDSVQARVTLNDDNATYTLSFDGTGAMENFASASATYWHAAYGSLITNVIVGDGITNIGEYALGLPNATTVKGGNTLSRIGNNAFEGTLNLLGIDLSRCALTEVAANSFGSQADALNARRAIYVTNEASAKLIRDTYTSDARSKTAVAVANGGLFADDVAFSEGDLASPHKEGYTFVTWATDMATQHPWGSAWKSLNDGVTFYAKFTEKGPEIVEPVAYPGAQGLDQTVMLLDNSRLPSSVVKHPGILFYGENDEHYDNRITDAYNGNRDIVFSFNMSRGNNANGGDGTYQINATLPHISIIDDQGNTVASYNDGNGALKLFNIVFDGVDGKAVGNTIWAIRFGVVADALEEGTYTLRFGKDFVANNGKSFLGKNVDFQFEVETPPQYELAYDTSGATAVVTGITIHDDQPVTVTIPETFEGKAVTAIAPGAFQNENLIKSVSIPANVTAVGDNAFANMSAVESIMVTNHDATTPVWGSNVFTGSKDLKLYGYATAQTVIDVAALYQNVTFVPLEDGIYVDNVAVVDGGTVSFNASDREGEVTILSGTKDVTDNYSAYISNTNVVSHPGTAMRLWQYLTAQANGEADLVIKDSTGVVFATLKIKVTGLTNEASTSKTPLTGYQGNGSTIALTSPSNIETISFNETLPYYDNYILDPVNAEGATFTLALAGPGSAWGIDRWDWDDWTQNHLNGFITIRDAQTDQIVAAVGNGITWVTLTDSGPLTFAVDPGVLTPEKEYVLVAGKELTGHNTAAALLKEVRWTFTTQKTDIEESIFSQVGPQKYLGSDVIPAVSVSVPVLEVKLWDTTKKAIVTTPGSERLLDESSDYTIGYSANTGVGTGKITITGVGSYTGTKVIEFLIYDDTAGVEDPVLTYTSHVQDYGWIGSSTQNSIAKNGEVSGTSKQGLRAEAIQFNLTNQSGYSGGLKYATHIQTEGWQDYRIIDTNGFNSEAVEGPISGTQGQSLRLEALRIELTGALADIYDIYYRVHAQEVGWMGWAKNGAIAGTAGLSYRLEAIQVYLVKKSANNTPALDMGGAVSIEGVYPAIDALNRAGSISYDTTVHIQDIGDKTYSNINGSSYIGTSGESKRLEALTLTLNNTTGITGGIEYKTHIQDIGWQDMKPGGQLSGTSGQSKRLEAIAINLTGDLKDTYDVYYRTHVQEIGWTGWAKNGQNCGTAGKNYRMEAMQIVIVKQGTVAPGVNVNFFVQG